jgi:hypothetical protein
MNKELRPVANAALFTQLFPIMAAKPAVWFERL